MGIIGEQSVVLFHVLCGRIVVKLRSGCKNAEGCVGKSEEDLRCEHRSQEALSVADYTSKIKDICDSLPSIEVNIEERETVQVCLGGLAPKFGAFRTVVSTRENTPSFFDLQSMLLVEENHACASTSTHTDNKMLYTEGDRPRGCGGRGEIGRNGGG